MSVAIGCTEWSCGCLLSPWQWLGVLSWPGIFGMNLQSGLETNNYAFAIVAIAITALVAMLTLITSMCFGRTELAG